MKIYPVLQALAHGVSAGFKMLLVQTSAAAKL
jgi:hypothetical protein